MSFILYFLPLLFVFIVSYYLNVKKRSESKLVILKISVLESIICFAFIGVFLITKVISVVSIYFILVALAIVAGGILFWNNNDIKHESDDFEEDMDIQFETMKNALILFLISILPFYLFLTLFRFMNPWIQFIVSIGLTVGMIYLHSIIVGKVKPFFFRLSQKFPSPNAWFWFVLSIIISVSALIIGGMLVKNRDLLDYFYVINWTQRTYNPELDLSVYNNFNILHVILILSSLFFSMTSYRKSITVFDWTKYVYTKYVK